MPQSQVFYPPGSIVSQGPIPGQKNNSKEEVVLPQDELMELAPEITTRDGKMDNFSASILDMLGESRRVMESFIAEARNDIASYNELALRNSSEINQLISEEKKATELTTRVVERIKTMTEDNYTNVQRTLEFQKILVEKLQEAMKNAQEKGAQVVTISDSDISRVRDGVMKSLQPLYSQLRLESQHFQDTEREIWNQRFYQLQSDLQEFSAWQFQNLLSEVNSSQLRWSQEIASEQRNQLEYELEYIRDNSKQLAISVSGDVERHIQNFENVMMRAISDASNKINNRELLEHRQRLEQLNYFLQRMRQDLGGARASQLALPPSSPKLAIAAAGQPQAIESSETPSITTLKVPKALPAPKPDGPPSESSKKNSESDHELEDSISRAVVLSRKPTRVEVKRLKDSTASQRIAERSRDALKNRRSERYNLRHAIKLKERNPDFVYE